MTLTEPTNHVAPAVLTHPGAGQGDHSSMTDHTVPDHRPARRRREPVVGVAASFDVADMVDVTADGDLCTIQLGTGASLRLVGPVEDVTFLIAEAYRQLLHLPGNPAATTAGGAR